MATTPRPGKSVPRHTRDDALTPREFQLLLDGANRMDDYEAQQARFLALVMGRLGLRRGEIAHMRCDWIDWHRSMLVIPRHEPCRKGRDGGACGHCRQMAAQKVDHADSDADLTLKAAVACRWEPKTAAAAREVPFDFEPRVALEIERFFDRYEAWPLSCQAVNRRIQRATELAPGLDAGDTYPHCLRGTAATYHAARGLNPLALQALLGWVDLTTAQAYVARSGENTARALHAVHAQ